MYGSAVSRTSARLLVAALLSCLSVGAAAALKIEICGGAGSPMSCASPNACLGPGCPQGSGGADALSIGQEVSAVDVREGEAGSGVRAALSPAAERVPEGWQDARTPPATVEAEFVVTYEFNTVHSTLAGACDEAIAAQNINPNYIYTLKGMRYGSPTIPGQAAGYCDYDRYRVDWDQHIDGTITINAGPGTGLDCPAGYIDDGNGACELMSPAAVMKPADQECGLVKMEGAIVMDPQDPDCGGAGGSGDPLAVSCAGGSCTATAQDNGDTWDVEWSSSGGGGESITITHTPSGGGGGGSVQIGLNPGAGSGGSGVITGVDISGELPGGGSGNGGGDDNGNGDGPGGDGYCAHCATEATLREVRDLLQDGVSIDERGSDWAQGRADAESAGQGALDGLDAQAGQFGDAAGSGDAGDAGIPGLSQFGVPETPETFGIGSTLVQGGACTPLTLSVWSTGDLELNYCPVAESFRPMINWGTAALTAIYCYARIFRRREEEEA